LLDRRTLHCDIVDEPFIVPCDEGVIRRVLQNLGLAFCRMAVEAHLGTIGLESETGQRSTFHFTFPVSAPAKIEQLASSSLR
jgi:K+-sensing histidine kinase KdpD